MKALSDYATSRNNNFNLIRFFAACMVLYSHSFALAQGDGYFDPLRSIVGITFGTIAVDIFFITSGFLITASLLLRDNLIAFVWNRILRIYPALIIAIVFCVFVVGVVFTTLKTGQYLLDPDTYKFLIKNTTLVFGLHHTLPHVFESVPYKSAINGSLWTLPIEIRMYGLLFLMGLFCYMFCRFNKKYLFFIIVSVGTLSLSLHVMNHYLEFVSHRELARELKLLSMFFVGSSLYVLKDKVILSSRATMVMIGMILIASLQKDAFYTLYYVFIGYIVIWFAYIPSGIVREFNRFGDYSYGMYIYAFPVQQSIAVIVPGISVSAMILISFFITLLLAFISWHVIEKNILKHKDKHVYIENFFRSVITKRLTNLYTWKK